MTKPLIYTLRPDGTSLWLPADMAKALGIRRRDRLTPEQLESREIQELIEERKLSKS